MLPKCGGHVLLPLQEARGVFIERGRDAKDRVRGAQSEKPYFTARSWPGISTGSADEGGKRFDDFLCAAQSQCHSMASASETILALNKPSIAVDQATEVMPPQMLRGVPRFYGQALSWPDADGKKVANHFLGTPGENGLPIRATCSAPRNGTRRLQRDMSTKSDHALYRFETGNVGAGQTDSYGVTGNATVSRYQTEQPRLLFGIDGNEKVIIDGVFSLCDVIRPSRHASSCQSIAARRLGKADAACDLPCVFPLFVGRHDLVNQLFRHRVKARPLQSENGDGSRHGCSGRSKDDGHVVNRFAKSVPP